MDVSRRPTGLDAPDGEPAVPPVLAVVGESRDDPDCLLLRGEDGLHYRYQLNDGTTMPVVPDEAWVIDGDHNSVHASLPVNLPDPEPV